MLMLALALWNNERMSGVNTYSEPKSETEESNSPARLPNIFSQGRVNLDSETDKFIYGTWNVKKHLGFADSYNDAFEYPTGQKIIGEDLVIENPYILKF
ncbi:hypothetical protein NST38_31170 [Paenibacillus sp. FSL H8-0104]|uniref:hypothetical protein n=1 Tax=Paenibacillus sp. FSL H8-0104 TaxID=2954509 RepID=UPI0030FD9B8E